MNVLIAGAGYIGSALAGQLADDGHSVTALRRNPPDTNNTHVRWLAADLLSNDPLSELTESPDSVVFCASPGEFSESAYRQTYRLAQQHLVQALQARGANLQRYIMVSSTAVYPLGEGEWVDTTTPEAPQRFTGHVLLNAERWLREQLGHRLVVTRLTGIYGPGRWQSMVERLIERGCNPAQYSNRIHRDDAVGFLRHLLGMVTPAPLYLVSDSQPSDQCTIANWVAERLGRAAPQEAPDRASPRGNRRVSNRAMLETGYRLQHPDFRSGLEQAIAADSSTTT